MDINIDELDFQTIRLIDENGSFQEINLKNELSIDENRLDSEMLQQPSKYVYWASVLEKIRLFQENANLEMEILMGQLDEEARNMLPGKGVKPTKDSVEAYIKRTDQYKKAMDKCHYYDYLVKRLQFIVKSFEQRKDMLQSFGKQKTQDQYYGKYAGRFQEKD